jgi:hypothetical protein
VDSTRAPELLRASDSARDDLGAALIVEAKQPTRRRRLIYGGAVALAAIAAAAVFTLSGGSTPSAPGAARHVPATTAFPPPTTTVAPTPTPLGAAEVWGPDAASTLLASYVQIHDGFVYVYGDGRVIWHNDAPWGSREPTAYERRLSPRGLGLVWSGVLVANDFNEGRPVPVDAWIDPPNMPYAPWTPAEFAGCLYQESLDPGGYPSDATHRLGDLPASARALLHTQRTYPHALSHYTGRATSGECFVLTPEEARTAAPTLSPQNLYTPVELIPASADAGAIRLWVLPVLPHGETFMWGG